MTYTRIATGLVPIVLISIAWSLAAKGYEYRYVYSLDSKHCERKVFEHTLADTLVWMWQDFSDK